MVDRRPYGGRCAWAAIAAIPLASGSAWLALTSDHVADPADTAAFHAFSIAVPMLVGAVWCARRPRNPVGPLLVLYGLLWTVISWQDSNAALPHSLGVVSESPTYVLTFVLILAFPTGRLETRADRVAVTLLCLVAVAAVPVYLTRPELVGGGVFAGCDLGCPPNPFYVGPPTGWIVAFEPVRTALIPVVAALVLLVFLRRLRLASRPRKRAMLAIGVSSLLFLPAFVAYQSARRVFDAGEATTAVLGGWVVFARLLFPLGFAIALVQSELFAGAALRRLLSGLAARPSLACWRDAVAEALDDPSLRIGFWNPTVGRHVELDGTLLDETPGRLWVEVERGGEPAAAITCDEVLAEEPELLRAVAEATLVALQTESLGRELRESRARLVGVADAERRKLGRDLHDSAQQRLVALRMRLGESAEATEVDHALSELRALARGLHPPLLSRYGVAAALEAFARVSAIPVTIEDEMPERFSESIEATAYFCCLEALQNAAKHAGPSATATVRLEGTAEGLRFVIDDDGHGFDPDAPTSGAGLRNLADRLEAVGGTLAIRSAFGQGTRVTGFVPAAAAVAAT